MFISRKLVPLATAAAAFLLVASPVQAQIQDRNIRASLVLSKDHSLGVGLTKYSQCVGEKSGGRMKVQTFFDGALGNDAPAIAQLRSGTLDMVVTATSAMSQMIPSAAVYDLPFLFADEKEADAALDGKSGALLSRRMLDVGLVNLTYLENGFRNATNSKHPINKMEDLKGLKIRSMPNPMVVETFKALGGFAFPMPFTELYSALETKAVDGQEKPVPIIETAKFFEVQKYLSMTRHMYNPALLLYSKPLFDKLNPAEQTVLRDCANAVRDEQRKINRQMAAEGVDRLKAKGMVVNAIAPAEVTRMREASKVVYEKNAPVIGADMMALVEDDLKRVRK
ncbi:MAG: DctP family TRAP transporter solute-binding subunit [Hydrogenophaga sp.]|uniref:DctP family TRAP transporter solute-binding subunit n=1 Tax=Hydrogenophaga sp. TaxID=1904254 RepID=UPI003D103FB3